LALRPREEQRRARIDPYRDVGTDREVNRPDP
jgi:hypothetical protein